MEQSTPATHAIVDAFATVSGTLFVDKDVPCTPSFGACNRNVEILPKSQGSGQTYEASTSACIESGEDLDEEEIGGRMAWQLPAQLEKVATSAYGL